MALLNSVFELASVPEREERTTDFSPIPAGWYTAMMMRTEIRPTKKGGEMINIRYDITGPEHVGRVVFGNINIANDNPMAVQIGHEQLGQILRAIGLDRLRDTDELSGHTLQIKVEIRKSEGYPDANEVRAWRAVQSSAPKSPFADLKSDLGAEPAAKKASTNKANPPWVKN